MALEALAFRMVTGMILEMKPLFEKQNKRLRR